MSWADYKVPTTDVDDGTGKMRPVRGLSLDDMGQLATSHIDAMINVADLYIARQKDILATNNITDLFVAISRSAPKFVSEVVSLVTDTPGLKGVSLPAPVQLSILSASFKLTVQDAGGLGNLSATLQSVVRQAVAGRGEVSQRLQELMSNASIGAVEKTPTS